MKAMVGVPFIVMHSEQRYDVGYDVSLNVGLVFIWRDV